MIAPLLITGGVLGLLYLSRGETPPTTNLTPTSAPFPPSTAATPGSASASPVTESTGLIGVHVGDIVTVPLALFTAMPEVMAVLAASRNPPTSVDVRVTALDGQGSARGVLLNFGDPRQQATTPFFPIAAVLHVRAGREPGPRTPLGPLRPTEALSPERLDAILRARVR